MTNTMRTLGMLVRAIWPDGEVPDQVFEVAVARPATGLALLQRKISTIPPGDPRHGEFEMLVKRLPADLADPSGGVAAADQGPFWLGYYHYAGGLDRARELGPAALERIGEALYGPRWQSDLARDLQLSDARRVRQWMARERPIPAGVWADIGVLAKQRSMTIEQIISGDLA